MYRAITYLSFFSVCIFGYIIVDTHSEIKSLENINNTYKKDLQKFSKILKINNDDLKQKWIQKTEDHGVLKECTIAYKKQLHHDKYFFNTLTYLFNTGIFIPSKMSLVYQNKKINAVLEGKWIVTSQPL